MHRRTFFARTVLRAITTLTPFTTGTLASTSQKNVQTGMLTTRETALLLTARPVQQTVSKWDSTLTDQTIQMLMAFTTSRHSLGIQHKNKANVVRKIHEL